MARTKRIPRTCKLIMSQVIIDENIGEYFFGPSKSIHTLILKNLGTDELETVELPVGVDSNTYIKDKVLNNDAFIKFEEEDVYEEVYVSDRTESNIVLNKLKKSFSEAA